MFDAVIDRIGVNPFVTVPDDILAMVFGQAGRSKEAISVLGTTNGQPYTKKLIWLYSQTKQIYYEYRNRRID